MAITFLVTCIVNRLLRRIAKQDNRQMPGRDAKLELYKANVINFANTYHAVTGKQIKIRRDVWN